MPILRRDRDELSSLDLVADGGRTVATLVPARGGIASRFRVSGRDVFYLDGATLTDPTKNVRGGCPVLFPSPGKLRGDAWSRAGREGAMKQHGFARNLAWTVEDETPGEAPAVTLAITSSAETRAAYPWDFRVALRYVVGAGTLRIEQVVTNTTEGGPPMPFGFGFHPYFAVPQADKARAAITTAATRAWDNVAKEEIAFGGFTPGVLSSREVDMHLLDHGSSESTLTLPDRAVRVLGSPEYTHWVVWTLEGKGFVCLEPWTCPGNALNTGDRVLSLAPGASRSLWIAITATLGA